MRLRTFKRYEKKYLIPGEVLDEFLEEISKYMDSDKYCINGEKYTIYNIYYDDESGNVIQHSLSKPYYKEKLRIRSYVPFDNPDGTVFVELKKKIGGIVSKRRATMTLDEAIRLTEKKEKVSLKKYLDNQVADEVLFFLQHNDVKPAAHISYERQAFFGKEDSDFRLTIDCNIKGRNCDFFQKSSDKDVELLKKDCYLMEIKILGSIPMWLTQVMSRLGIFRLRFSKYGTFYKLSKYTEETKPYFASMHNTTLLNEQKGNYEYV